MLLWLSPITFVLVIIVFLKISIILLLLYFIVLYWLSLSSGVFFLVFFFGCHRYFNFVIIVYHSFVSVFMVVTLYFGNCIGYHFYFEWLTPITFVLNSIVVFKKL